MNFLKVGAFWGRQIGGSNNIKIQGQNDTLFFPIKLI